MRGAGQTRLRFAKRLSSDFSVLGSDRFLYFANIAAHLGAPRLVERSAQIVWRTAFCADFVLAMDKFPILRPLTAKN